MRLIRVLVLLLLIYCLSATFSYGQQSKWTKQPRILILLDGSSSMVESWSGQKQRYKAAHDIILSLMDSIYKVNDKVEFGLRVFGHQHSVTEKNCYDTKNEVPFTKNNYVQMELRLNDIRPYGITPLAYSIAQSAEVDMVDEHKYVYTIILITDGEESCGGDICNVVKNLLEKKIYSKPYVISLVNVEALRDVYACVGNYLEATTDNDIAETVRKITEAYRPMLKLPAGDMNELKTLAASSPSFLQVDTPTSPIKEETKKESAAIKEPPAAKQQIEQTIIAIAAKQNLIPSATTLDPILKPATFPEITLQQEREKESYVILTLANTPKQFSILFTKPVYKPVALPKLDTGIFFKAEHETEQTIIIAIVAKQDPIPLATTLHPILKPTTFPEITLQQEREKESYAILPLANTPKQFSILFTKPAFKAVAFPKLDTGLSFKEEMQPLLTPQPKEAVSKPKPPNGTLKFVYKGTTTPVKGYLASVHPGNSTTVIEQATDKERSYEPGRYSITLNTRPLFRSYADLQPGNTTVIEVPRPGQVQFTNTEVIKDVSLYVPLGGKYVRFLTLDITGQLDKQILELLSGVYQARFIKNPSIENNKETIVPFEVEANTVTKLELK